MDVNDTEKRILQAAEQEFMQKGFAGARTTVIAEKAGVTHAMLHYYFRTKEKIFEKVISEKITMIKEIIVSSITEEKHSLEEVIQSIIDRHLTFLSENPNLPRFFIGEIFSHPERLEIVKEKIAVFANPLIKRLQTMINHYASIGVYKWVDAKTLLLDIISLNVFPYMISPLVNSAFNGMMEDRNSFLEKRKFENYETIIRKLDK